MDIMFASAALRPPVLDNTNYSLWKRVINGCTPPLATDQEGDNRPKPESDWTADEVKNSNHNSKALNAIFTSVDMNMFSLITNCTSAKSAWDILQCHCEGSESVRQTRLRMLTSKFEMMRMEESESILEYDCRLREVANEAFSAGEAISSERLVSKILRSLPERFNIKICAIDEDKGTSKMSVEDLISPLRTFEMNLDMQKKDKGKTIALQTTNDSYSELLQISQEVNDSDLCEDSISFITKKFGDYLKRIRDKKKDTQTPKSPSLPASEKPQRFPAKLQIQTRNEGKGQLKPRQYDSVQCRECQGFDHYANECANRLRKNKRYNVFLSDEESDLEEKPTDEDNQTSLTALLKETRWLQVNPLGVALGVATPGRNICEKSVCLNSTVPGNLSEEDLEVNDEELTLESVQELYEELFEDWTKRNKLNANLMKENAELKSVVKENTDLKAVVAKLEVILSKNDLELGHIKEELQKATETLSKFNSSTSKLDTILSMGRDDKKGLGFKGSVFEVGESSKATVFVKEKADKSPSPQPQINSQSKRSSPKREPVAPISKKRKRRYVCHYCFKHGHIRPYCFKLRDDLMNQKTSRMLPRMLYNISRNTSYHRPTVRQIWVPKVNTHCKVVYTSLKTNTTGHWYFDSGSSRHMTGSKEHLVDYVEQKCGRVTYGGGEKGKIVGKGTLNVEGIRSSDNCYQIGEDLSCKHVQITELDLWHQKLRHANFKTLKNLSKYDAVRGKAFLMNFRHQKHHNKMVLPNGVSEEWDQLAKFDSKSDKCLFLGYATNSRAYRMFNLRTRTIVESVNVVFDDCADLKKKTAEDDIEDLLDNPISLENRNVAPDVPASDTTCDTEVTESGEPHCDDYKVDDGSCIPTKIQKNHPSSQIIGNIHGDVQTRQKEKIDYRKMAGLI
ncbi:uncharacterized protein [Primulina eburnea]|uniref:uncharacterized protein n=1 Tax=Primulina eburnea TaxID=1245227 RepID=UPI003C6BF1DD